MLLRTARLARATCESTALRRRTRSQHAHPLTCARHRGRALRRLPAPPPRGVTRALTAQAQRSPRLLARRAPCRDGGVRAGRLRPHGGAGSCRARHLGRGHRARPAVLRRRGVRVARAGRRTERRSARRADQDGRHTADGVRPRPRASRGGGRAHGDRDAPSRRRVRGGHGALPAAVLRRPRRADRPRRAARDRLRDPRRPRRGEGQRCRRVRFERCRPPNCTARPCRTACGCVAPDPPPRSSASRSPTTSASAPSRRAAPASRTSSST